MKTYPLDVEVNNHDQVTIFSRGHHDLATFNKAAEGFVSDFPKIRFAEAKQEWWRAVPDGDGGSFLINAKPNSRGAWPVTVIEEAYP